MSIIHRGLDNYIDYPANIHNTTNTNTINNATTNTNNNNNDKH